MNSIDLAGAADDAALDAALEALFDEILMPLASRMRAEGEEAFPLKPDVSWLSYYVRRRRSVATAADFNTASCADPSEFEARLAAHWQSLGRTGLLPLAGQFASVAAMARARCMARTVQPELSPYVYAMF